MIALIDGDMAAYRCASACEPNKSTRPERAPLGFAISRLDELIYRILNTTQCEEYRIFLSGPRNFRETLYPAYKANRKRLVRPEYLGACRDFLIREWKAEICDGYEADDGIGIAANESTIIVSNDKDFKQIPGQHYNPVTNEFEVVDEQTAALNFYSQMLIGDSSDNVDGIAGLGKKRAPKALYGLDAGQMHARVSELYGDERQFLLNFRLLRLLRSVEEWEDLQPELESAYEWEAVLGKHNYEAPVSQGQGTEVTTEGT